MYPDDVAHYLAQIGRVLRPGGRLVYFAGVEWRGTDEVIGPASIEVRLGAPGAVLESAGPLVIMTR